jgi:hypothetical protein
MGSSWLISYEVVELLVEFGLLGSVSFLCKSEKWRSYKNGFLKSQKRLKLGLPLLLLYLRVPS